MPLYRPSSQEGKNRAIIVWMPMLLGIALAIGLFAGASLWGNNTGIRWSRTYSSDEDDGRRFNEILRMLEFKYVEEIDLDSLSNASFQGILQGLDPYSAYIPAESLDEWKEQSEGQYYGIGLEFQLINDTVTITSLLDQEAPVNRSGLQPGDQVLEVDGMSVSGIGIPLDSLIHILRGGAEDPAADLKVRKWTDKKVLELKVSRTDIKIRSVIASYLIYERTAYIRIERFSNTTYREFMEALEKLSGQVSPPLDIIIDLRGNPGGYLEEAVKITSQFFREKDRLIVRTQGANSDSKEYKTTGKVFFNIDKLAILINRNTASGAEILAAAIQDWDRGVVVGEASFGKGSVQEQFFLSNGDALRLTTAKYFTPTGRSIHKIAPEMNMTAIGKKEQVDASHRRISGDSALLLTRVKKRKVYGGAGVQPDILIPNEIDSMLRDSSLRLASIKESIGIYKELFKHAPDKTDLKWLRDQMVANELNPGHLNKEETYKDEDGRSKRNDYLSEITYAEVAGMIWGEDAKQQFLNQSDPVIEAALRFMVDKSIEDLPQPAY